MAEKSAAEVAQRNKRRGQRGCVADEEAATWKAGARLGRRGDL